MHIVIKTLCDKSMKLGTILDGSSIIKTFKVSPTPKMPCEGGHLDFQNGSLFLYKTRQF